MKKIKLTERERDFLWSMTKSSCGATTTGYVTTFGRRNFTDEEQCKLLDKLEHDALLGQDEATNGN